MFDLAAILCEDARRLLEARGRYTQLAAYRRFVNLYRWNTEAKTYERVSLGPTGAPDVRVLEFDAARMTLSYPSVVRQSSYRGEALDSTSVMTIGNAGHEVMQTLRSRSSDFTEHYQESAKRRTAPSVVPSPSAQAAELPDLLGGHWTSEARHLYRDGTVLVERGAIACRWVLDQTYLQCDRRHAAPDDRQRSGIQLWTRDSSGARIDVITLTAGRFERVLQRSTRVTADSCDLAGDIPTRDGKWIATRGSWRVLSADRLVYHNETEESPGTWRIDFEEILTRSK